MHCASFCSYFMFEYFSCPLIFIPWPWLCIISSKQTQLWQTIMDDNYWTALRIRSVFGIIIVNKETVHFCSYQSIQAQLSHWKDLNNEIMAYRITLKTFEITRCKTILNEPYVVHSTIQIRFLIHIHQIVFSMIKTFVSMFLTIDGKPIQYIFLGFNTYFPIAKPTNR